MGKANFSDDFKRDAVHQITKRGYSISEVSKRLRVSTHSLYAWKKLFSRRVIGFVMTVAPPAHSGLQIMGCQECLPLMAGELAALVGMDP